MMNNASFHREVTIHLNDGNTKTLKNVQLMVSGNFLVANGLPVRDEEKNEKYVATDVIPLDIVAGYDTITKYHPDAGLDKREQLNG